MKIFTVLVIGVLCSLAALPQSAGIKSDRIAAYYKHNPAAGFDALQKNIPHELFVEYSQSNSTPAAIYGRLTEPGFCSNTSLKNDVFRFFSSNKDIFGLLNPEAELKVLSSFTDNLSTTHVKFQQYVNNIKIYPSELVVHINKDGSIESVTGNYLPTPLIGNITGISSSEAVNSAKKFLGEYSAEDESYELIYFRKNLTLSPAYEVKLPSKAYPKMVLFINALDGSLIYKDDGLRYDGPAVGTGVNLKGFPVTINTYLLGGKYYMADASLPMYVPPIDSLTGIVATYDAKNSTTGNGYEEAELVWDPNNDNVFNDNIGLRAAVDAHVFTQKVYNFYRNNFNRNSFDGSGGTLMNVVHYKSNYNNAFWNGLFLTYGDGDGQQFSNLAGALDVICHEITHGVISSTANLNYVSQSGALNESFADVFASLLDSTNWLIGEDVFTPNIPGDALRSMQDPHNGDVPGGNNWQPAHMSEYMVLPETEEGDWGGVHINSGIPNKAFYNAATAIGRWKAGQIWYRTLTAYLTSNSQFKDMRISSLLAAKDLYGQGSAEYNAVQTAFESVGISDNTPTNYTLVYDDGLPETSVYENLPNWRLAVNFSAPAPSFSIDEVSIYFNGDANMGSGSFTLELFDQNTAGLPANSLVTPYQNIPPTLFGWQNYFVTGITVSTDFFVSVKYDGINWPLIGADNPPGNNRSFEYDPGIQSWYRLTGSGNYTLFMRAKVSSSVSSVEIESAVPELFEVSESYPNPFNPSTQIKYSLPESEKVVIVVYDLNGNKVAELANKVFNAGTYTVTWNGRNDEGLNVSSGIYYCRIEAGGYSAVKKMVLLK
jgi:bacillolysin